MKKKRFVVAHYLDAGQLAALLWEGAPNFNYANSTFEEALEECREKGEMPLPVLHRGIRMVVTDELRMYGEASIETGPQRGWNDDQQEAWYISLVEQVYRLNGK